MWVQSFCSSERSWGLGVPSWLYGTVPETGKSVSQPFLPAWCQCFLIHLMCESPSASFWISFSRNYSVCSSTFGVFTGGGDPWSLLFLKRWKTFSSGYKLIVLQMKYYRVLRRMVLLLCFSFTCFIKHRAQALKFCLVMRFTEGICSLIHG